METEDSRVVVVVVVARAWIAIPSNSILITVIVLVSRVRTRR